MRTAQRIPGRDSDDTSGRTGNSRCPSFHTTRGVLKFDDFGQLCDISESSQFAITLIFLSRLFFIDKPLQMKRRQKQERKAAQLAIKKQ